MPSHVWGGAELKTPEGIPVYFPEPERRPPPCPQPPRRGLPWFRDNRAAALTLLNLLVLAAAFFLVNLLAEPGATPIGGGWALRATFFPDEESGVLSLRFESNRPEPLTVPIMVAVNGRSVQSFQLDLPPQSPWIDRRRLDIRSTDGTVEIWVSGKKIRVSRR